MPRVEFEPTTPVFQRAKTVHALDHPDTVIGLTLINFAKILNILNYNFAYNFMRV
jgi:hypothetical protein